jgi:thiamine biosynthesis lipoprotein
MTAAAAPVTPVRHVAVMGTVVTFDVRTPASAPVVKAAIDEAEKWLHWVDGTFSTYQYASEVNRFDRGELAVGACCAEMRAIVALCHRYNERTGGFFDAWAAARFDPSGVVKGWSIDRASDILVAHGLTDHAIDGGGDVRLRGAPGHGGLWNVGVRHPFRRDAFCAALSVGSGALATSGTYERGLHVLDPFTGRPAAALAAVTVFGPDLTSADAYATAALAMGLAAPRWLEALEGYESQVITADGGAWATPGFGPLELDLPPAAKARPTPAGA